MTADLPGVRQLFTPMPKTASFSTGTVCLWKLVGLWR
jgi:hypothetical protein